MTKTLGQGSSATPDTQLARPKGRPRKPAEQQLQARRMVRLSHADNARITERAAAAGLSVSAYLRQMALSGSVTVAPPSPLDFETRQELRRIGVNLNQIAKAMNAGRQVPPAALAAATAKLDAIFDVLLTDMAD